MNKKAVVYARVSSKEQGEGYSIPAQLDLLRAYASRHGISIFREFQETETASKEGRPSFNEMLSLIESDPSVNIILVEKTDRLYRNLRDWSRVDYKKLGIEIHLVKDNDVLSATSTSQQNFMHGIRALMAQNFSENLAEETKKGMRKKLELGGYPFSAPYGYINDKGSKELKAHPVEGPYVKRCFELYATGNYSLKSLSKLMYEEGMRAKRSDRKLTSESMKRILTRRMYYGIIEVRGTQYNGTHEPLVTKEIFETVSRMLKSNSKPKMTKKSFTYSGLMKCHHCGCSITAEAKKNGRYTYYHCTNGKGICSNVSWLNEDNVEREFLKALKSLSIPENILEQTRKALIESQKDQEKYHNGAIAKLSADEGKVQAAIEALHT